MQTVSFFRKTIGVILDPAPNTGCFFLKMTRKDKEGNFEKFSKGQGRTVALSLQEISQAIIQLGNDQEFSVFHRAPSGTETRIVFTPKTDNQLDLKLQDYIITLQAHERRIFEKLLLKTEDVIIHNIVTFKVDKEQRNDIISSSKSTETDQQLETIKNEIPIQTDPLEESHQPSSVDSSLLIVIRENFQGSWILSKITEKLLSLKVEVDRKELLDALEFLLQEGFITKEQRTAQVGHTYTVYYFLKS